MTTHARRTHTDTRALSFSISAKRQRENLRTWNASACWRDLKYCVHDLHPDSFSFLSGLPPNRYLYGREGLRANASRIHPSVTSQPLDRHCRYPMGKDAIATPWRACRYVVAHTRPESALAGRAGYYRGVLGDTARCMSRIVV